MQKNFLFKLASLSLALAVLLYSGCTEDGTGPDNPLGPVIEFVNDPGFLTGSADVAAGQAFSVKLRATAGDADLQSLRVLEDGARIEASRITSMSVEGITDINPPQSLAAVPAGAEQSGVWEITVEAQPTPGTVVTFGFEVTDDNGNRDIVSLDITTFGDLGVMLQAGAGYVSSDTTLDASATEFTVRLAASRGDSPLDLLSVEQDGNLIEASRITIEGVPADNNPYELLDIDQNGFDLEITVALDAAGQSDYAFIVTDETGNSVQADVRVGAGTAVTELNGVLLNQGGPQGQGGLDLDDGISTGTTTGNFEIAEIEDEGINLDLSPANNWRQQISGINGSVIRTPDYDNLPENFSFENIRTQEEIIAAFQSGLALTGSDASCNCSDSTSGEEVSEPVATGDLFLVNRGDKYYIVRVDAVNVEPTDNSDNYEMSIKH